MENKNALLTVKELSKLIKIPENSIRKAVLKKTFPIPDKRIGRLIRFSEKKVREYMEA